MKKFLEVLMDEDGKFHFSTEEEFITEEEFAAKDRLSQVGLMQESDRLLRHLINDLTEFLWRSKDQQISHAVRLLAVAEIMACADPYDRAEEFWGLMIFHTIPQFEHEAAAIKRQYGFNDRSVSRPWIGGTLPDGRMVGGPAGGPMMDFPLMEHPLTDTTDPLSFQPPLGKATN